MNRYRAGLLSFVGFPIWGLVIALVPVLGMKIYLTISDLYYGLASVAIPRSLVDLGEFGYYPDGAAGMIVVGVFYWLLYTVFYIMATKLMESRSPNRENTDIPDE